MKQLPASIILEKNKIATDNPWLILLDIKMPDDTMIYLVRNTENVTFQSQSYTAINFEIEPTKESSRGEIPTVTLKISNVTRTLQGYLEEQNGAIGAEITVRVVNSAHLGEDYSELEMVYDVLDSSADVYWATLTLGTPNPLNKRYPHKRYIGDHCGYKFKSRECFFEGNRWYASADRSLGNTVDPQIILTGTWTFTQSSATVSGSGGSALSEVSAGDWIRAGTTGTYYMVKSVTDDDTIILENIFAETTAPSTTAYKYNTSPYYYECTDPGITGGSPPTWPTTPDATVDDGTVEWTCRICKRTLSICRILGNSKRFGGYPGLTKGGLRLV